MLHALLLLLSVEFTVKIDWLRNEEVWNEHCRRCRAITSRGKISSIRPNVMDLIHHDNENHFVNGQNVQLSWIQCQKVHCFQYSYSILCLVWMHSTPPIAPGNLCIIDEQASLRVMFGLIIFHGEQKSNQISPYNQTTTIGQYNKQQTAIPLINQTLINNDPSWPQCTSL